MPESTCCRRCRRSMLQTRSPGGRRRTSVALDCHNREQFLAGKPVEKTPTRCARGTDCRATSSSLFVSRCNSSFLAANTESRCCPADIGDPRKMTDYELDSGKVTFCELNIFLVLLVCPTTSHFDRLTSRPRRSAVFSNTM